MASPELAAWLDWLERLHPVEIDLGLERTAHVAQRMGLDRPRVPVFTVAGTNGKGSVCAMLEAVLDAAGHRVGRYTSPHLVRYNERVRVAGAEAGDEALCEAFRAVEAARGDTSLTYFEFGTLAALHHFARSRADVLVLEVGLGGRLDATNVIDADVGVVTSIGLDHAEWLGTDIDGIAREKAGIARRGRPLVCAMAEPPDGLLAAAADRGAVPWRRGRAFDLAADPASGRWCWQGASVGHEGLPEPALAGGYQVDNAAAALAALEATGRLPAREAIVRGLAAAVVRGRFERHEVGGVEVILDVAHNPAAAEVLAATLAARPVTGRTLAVLGMYRDKDADGVAAALAPVVDGWYATGLAGARGRDAVSLADALRRAGAAIATTAENPRAAYDAALGAAGPGDRVLVAGSFATVADVSGLFL